MNKFKLFLLLLVFNVTLFAQDFDIKWSEVLLKESKKVMIVDIDYLDSDVRYHYFLFTEYAKRKVSYSLYKFDTDMKLVLNKKIDFSYDEKNTLLYHGSLSVKDKFFMFTSYFNSSKDYNYGFVSELSKEGDFSLELKELDAMPQEKKMNYGFFNVDISDDKTKILFSRLNPYKKNEQEKYALKVMNTDFEVLWEKEVALPYKDKDFQIQDYNIDNQGNAYLQGKLYEGKNDSKTTQDDYAYKIYMYSEGNLEPKEFELNIKDKLPIDVILKYSDNALHCTGLYSDYETRSASGVFHLDISKENNKATNLYTQDFSTSLRDEFRTDKQIKKDKNEDQGLPLFEVRDLLINDKGEQFLIAEQYKFWVETIRTYNGKTWTTIYIYNYLYGNILVTKFNPDGEVEWITNVPKYQHTTNDGGYYSSFLSKMHGSDSKIDLIFSELIPKKEAGSKKMEDRYTTKVVTIDQDGQSSENRLFNVADESTIFRPKKSVHLDETRSLIIGERKIDFKIGLLTY